MKKILGMPLYQPKLSDEEYVASVRIRLRKRRARAILFGVLGVIQMACFLAFSYVAFEFFPHDEIISSWVKPGFFGGLTLGVMAGICAVFGASYLFLCLEALRGNRTEQLLIRFHDRGHGDVPT